MGFFCLFLILRLDGLFMLKRQRYRCNMFFFSWLNSLRRQLLTGYKYAVGKGTIYKYVKIKVVILACIQVYEKMGRNGEVHICHDSHQFSDSYFGMTQEEINI